MKHLHQSISFPGKPRINLLVTDLDNTLWNWFDIWFKSFSAMLENLSDHSGIQMALLEAEIREIHQVRRTTEYTHLIQDIPSLNELYPDEDLAQKFAESIHAYRSARKKAMSLYPQVRDSLTYLKNRGTKIVAYTESLAYSSIYRLRKFELDGVIDVLYSPRDHEFPERVTPATLRTLENAEYELKFTEHRYTPEGHLKPDPEILQEIVSEMSNGNEEVAYIGDSLMKDIAMAQQAGVRDVWAKYGTYIDPADYEQLKRVSHWSDEDVLREAEIKKRPDVTPSYVLEDNFGQILDLFEFGST
jgi:FMN phosphatase YigB (HAD superfamily)